MTRPLRYALIALSLANLCFFRVWSAYFYGYFRPYFRKGEFLGGDYLALMVDVVLLAAVFWAGAQLLRRWKHSLAPTTLRASFLVVLLIVAHIIRVGLAREPVQPMTGKPQPMPGWEVALWVAIAVLAVYALWRWRVAASRVGVHLVLIAAPFVVVTFGQASWFTLQESPAAAHAEPPPARDSSAGRLSAPRVLWLVFDGLDQRLAFSERPEELPLPEFDRLRRQALYAENAYPPAGATMFSLPAFLTGKEVSYAEPEGPSELMVSLGQDLDIVPWSQEPNLFTRAREEGVQSGLVGWFHPYCRILGGDLAACAWAPFQFTSETRNLLERARDGLVLLLWCLPYADSFFNKDPLGLDPFPMKSYREAHRDRHVFTAKEAERMAGDASLGLVFAHLVIPHGPGIYDRQKSAYAAPPDPERWYLDNLALADRTLGDLRRRLEEAGLWERTAVVVTSDHNWRQSFSLDGKTDARVPFLVKLPAQKEGITYETELSTVLAHDLVLAILRGELSQAEQVRGWLSERRSREQVGPGRNR